MRYIIYILHLSVLFISSTGNKETSDLSPNIMLVLADDPGYPKETNPAFQGFDEFTVFASGNVDYYAHVDLIC